MSVSFRLYRGGSVSYCSDSVICSVVFVGALGVENGGDVCD
jgi:hypothetical protein